MRHPDQVESQSTDHRLSRRNVLRLVAGGLTGGALAVASACTAASPAAPAPTAAPTAATQPTRVAAPTAAPPSQPTSVAAPHTAAVVPTASAGSTSSAPATVAGVRLPTFVRFQGAKPDLPSTMDGVADAYLSYPRTNVKSVQRVPGRRGDVSVVTVNLGRPLQPLEQNPAWQEINRQLGVNLKVLAVPFADYSSRLNTLIAGDDLPDILYAGSATIPNLAEFFKAKCQDLTSFVSGDAIKDYPNLANLPTRAWKGMVYNGAIYAVPNAINYVVTYGMYVHQPLLDEIGAKYPTNADEFKRLMQELTRHRPACGA